MLSKKIDTLKGARLNEVPDTCLSSCNVLFGNEEIPKLLIFRSRNDTNV